MDVAAHGHGSLQRPVHPLLPSSSLVNHSGTATTASLPQGEASEHGSSIILNTDMTYSTLSSGSHTFPGSSLMPSSDNQYDTSGPIQFHPSTIPMRWISRPLSQRPPYDAMQPPRPQFFTSDALQPTSLPLQTAEPSFPLPAPPPQTSFGPLHTPHHYFPGQYAMHSHLPFHNQPAQSHLHDGYNPSGSSSYPPIGYYPLPLHPSLPYYRNEPGMHNTPSYQQMQYPHALVSQFATILPGSFHATGGARQYLSSSHSSTTYTGLPSECNLHQWHHHSGSPTNVFPTRPQRSSFGHSQSWLSRPHRDTSTIQVQSVEPERLPSPTPIASSRRLVTASRNTVSSTTAEPSERISDRNISKHDIHESSQRLAAVIPRAHDRPLVRRRYHPNPPPNRSEWVMWVGNVPNDANHDELWQFLDFSAPLSSRLKDSDRVKDSGIVSLFLLSRSNCAFVNYHSEEQLDNAIARFNGHQLRPNDPHCPRLVCRARRRDDDLRAGVGAQRGMGIHTRHTKRPSNQNNDLMDDLLASSKSRRSSAAKSVQPSLLPVHRDGGPSKLDIPEGTSPKVSTRSPSSRASTTSSFLINYFPKRFFILKSLTQYDLDLSVERGIWATQKHNESILDQAFRTSKEVILIFSGNKSGEFYGYGRMASAILRTSRDDLWAPRAEPSLGMPSPASGDFPSYDKPDPPRSSSHQSSQPHAVPSQSQLAEATLVPSSNETKADLPALSVPQLKSTQERRSAPPAFTCPSEDPRPPLRRKPHSAPLPVPGKHSEAGLGARGKSGGLVDDTSNYGAHLQPVIEEVHQGSGGEEDPKRASMGPRPQGLPKRSEARQHEPGWGGTFRVEWLQTARVPFHRTRHLRNPWNHGREIKVARDGTELEPSVGQQLIKEWPSLAGAAGSRAQSGAAAGSSGG